MRIGRVVFDHIGRKVSHEAQDVVPLHTVLVDLRAERDRYRLYEVRESDRPTLGVTPFYAARTRQACESDRPSEEHPRGS